jgi:glycosyltransferase involved in cell wall biosynthesis
VEEAGAGMVVPARDPRRLAEAIVEYARRRGALQPLRERARAWYAQHGTPQIMCEQYMRIYDGCAGRLPC